MPYYPRRTRAIGRVMSVRSGENEGEESMSRTDLDSHANMAVVERHAYILSDMGRTAEVNPFMPDYKLMQVPIINAAVQYECPYCGTLHVLVIRNALHVPSVRHNLVPPFMIREEGIQVNDTPKIQVNDPTTSDHSIYFPETNFRIPLSLWGVFSYFPSSKPTAQTLQETEEVYLLAPSRWNPHCDSYAQNEENMLDWEGNMVERKDRMQILIEDLPDGVKTIGSTQISCVESVRIDAIVEARAAEACEEIDPHTALSLLKRMKCLRFYLEYRPIWSMLNYWSFYQHAAILDCFKRQLDPPMHQEEHIWLRLSTTTTVRVAALETVMMSQSPPCSRAASEEKSTWTTSW